MPLEAQAKLLRVLNDGQIMRVGATKTRQVDVRVLAATHRNLEQRIRDGLFREDLYYRLSVVPINVPALREHPDDISELCEMFLKQAAADLNVPNRRLHPNVIVCLEHYPFPGNIRELKNIIERACILSTGEEIGVEHFPFCVLSPSGLASTPDRGVEEFSTLPANVSLRAHLDEMEKRLIQQALKETQGPLAGTARRLGISRSDLAYKMAKHDIKPEEPSKEN
jgi:DNA-binding NtrC family response regulator